MSGHPLKNFARHVRDTIGEDLSLAMPTYMWCLARVREHIDAARKAVAEKKPANVVETRTLVEVKLVELIKPHARKAGT